MRMRKITGLLREVLSDVSIIIYVFYHILLFFYSFSILQFIFKLSSEENQETMLNI